MTINGFVKYCESSDCASDVQWQIYLFLPHVDSGQTLV